ncbi:MAG: serine protease [Rhodobacter sp.]|nr:serine protease [Rhodobacter sp.]
MNSDEIREIYHDLSILAADGGTPPIKAGDSVVSGVDDRRDVHDLTDSNEDILYARLTRSTVILTDASSLTRNDDGTWTLAVQPYRQRASRFSPSVPPCPGEAFAHQHTGGWCSGFLVGEDVVVTAGHCGDDESAFKSTAFVFGFQAGSDSDPGTTIFDANQVYFGSELIARDLSPTGDFAVVRLDRKVEAPGAEALKIRVSGNPTPGSRLGVIGYPSGLPVKIAFGDETILINDNDPWLISNLDTYGGNSGSPVFNQFGEVEGILVRGATDYVFTGACFHTNFITDAAGSEAVTKASVWRSHIP